MTFGRERIRLAESKRSQKGGIWEEVNKRKHQQQRGRQRPSLAILRNQVKGHFTELSSILIPNLLLSA